MSKYRYIDGRQFEQQADGTWGPTRQQQVMDAGRQRAKERAAAEAELRARQSSPTPRNSDFGAGLLLGALLMGALDD